MRKKFALFFLLQLQVKFELLLVRSRAHTSQSFWSRGAHWRWKLEIYAGLLDMRYYPIGLTYFLLKPASLPHESVGDSAVSWERARWVREIEGIPHVFDAFRNLLLALLPLKLASVLRKEKKMNFDFISNCLKRAEAAAAIDKWELDRDRKACRHFIEDEICSYVRLATMGRAAASCSWFGVSRSRLSSLALKYKGHSSFGKQLHSEEFHDHAGWVGGLHCRLSCSLHEAYPHWTAAARRISSALM